YEMLHRGLITEKQLDDYLKSADYAPVWRPLLKAISFDPLTRVDVRRAYKLGVVSLEDVKATYRSIGYDEKNATILTEFTRVDADEERKQERELLVGPVKSSALAMYKARRIGEAQLRQTLSNLGYPKELVDRFVADIDFAREQDRREDVAAALKASYVKALRSRDDTIAILTKAGYNDLELAQLLETWDILREATELQPHQAAQRRDRGNPPGDHRRRPDIRQCQHRPGQTQRTSHPEAFVPDPVGSGATETDSRLPSRPLGEVGGEESSHDRRRPVLPRQSRLHRTTDRAPVGLMGHQPCRQTGGT
ncbi:MAG: hypothetical protein EBY17_31455, partial [Acidobacteriia bacterium]|nr:hypothetical protein [Terriglobia bacterium]